MKNGSKLLFSKSKQEIMIFDYGESLNKKGVREAIQGISKIFWGK